MLEFTILTLFFSISSIHSTNNSEASSAENIQDKKPGNDSGDTRNALLTHKFSTRENSTRR